MATLVERPSADGTVRWKALVRLSGHPIRSKTFRRKTDAVRWAAKVEVELRDGKRIATAENERRTLGDLIDRYLDTVVSGWDREASRSEGIESRRLSRRADTRRRHLAWWREALGDVRLLALSPAELAAARDRLTEERAPSTVNRYLSSLGAVLKVAVNEWGWIPESPLRRVTRKKEPPGCGRPLTEEEIGRLLEECRKSAEWRLYPAALIALSTGMRASETMELTWDRIDLVGGWITLQQTKNDEPRRVPLKAQALEVIREHARTRRRVGVDLIFARKDGLKPKEIRRHWVKARDAAGLQEDGRRFRWHDLRVSAATWLAENGATVFDLMKVFGWKTPVMAARYVRLSETRAAVMVEAMNERLFPASNGRPWAPR